MRIIGGGHAFDNFRRAATGWKIQRVNKCSHSGHPTCRKPDKGDGLAPAGKARAKAYVNYFKNYTVDGQPLKLDHLFAAADSKQSHRARLTLEPTSKKLGLAIDCQFEDLQFQKLADEIRTKMHGKNILICWHHGEIPQLVQALGADSDQLFQKGKWPDAVYNWVIELRYDLRRTPGRSQAHH